MVSCASARVGVHCLSFAFHISVFFHSLFFACSWILFVFLPYGRRICAHSVNPSLTHFLDLEATISARFPVKNCSCMERRL